MRAKQSSIASGIFSRSGPLTPPIPIRASAGMASLAVVPRGVTPICSRKTTRSAAWAPATLRAGVAQGEGLLHDARNLTGALGLYCDLLSLPGVLKPEHIHYAAELRLLGTRSGVLMERLTLSLLASDSETTPARAIGTGVATAPCPVSLREIVERCSGLLGRVAGGRTIELSYGPASSSPVLAEQEDVERILVNLVRNAAAALEARGRAVDGTARSTVREVMRDPTADPDPEAVRIGIGLLQGRVGDSGAWPFRRVRLTVEDSGCGMLPEQLERLLHSGRAPSRGGRGIGFRVVRELVAAGGGDLRVSSAPQLGTRVQIEWPLATASTSAAACEGRSPAC
jgi:signal transduction histidine kinase